MEERIWKAVESWNAWARKQGEGIPREVAQKAWEMLGGQEALYFYGPRRAGKTTVCAQLLCRLSKKFGEESCLFINFEEPAFSGMLTPALIDDVLSHHEMVHKKMPRFLFLDEVQNVSGWEKWVRSATDKGEFKVFVTGSSAKLLSSEFATTLGGRGLGFLVLPFSFCEFRQALPDATLEDYLQIGGYPAVVLEKNRQTRMRLLEEYFETAISRDIAARHQVRDVPTLKTLALYVLTNSGKLFSYNKLRAFTGLSFDAIKMYLSYLESAFVIFSVPSFSYSLKKAMEKPRKYYAYDVGLAAAVSKSYSPDFGRKAENLVAIGLVRMGREPQYYSDKTEVDFVVKDGLKPVGINVCYLEKPPARERAALEEFSAAHKNAKTVLIAGKKALGEWLKETGN